MPVAEGTGSKVNLMKEEGMRVLLQEILRKLESLDSRVSNMEIASQGQDNKGRSMNEEE